MTVHEVVSLIYGSPKNFIGELLVDAFVNESHSFSAELSEHSVESGEAIVDHVRNMPLSLNLNGIISNTPMSLIGLTVYNSAQRFLKKDSNNFVELALKKIEDIFAKREPITIATSLKTYSNMVLESLTVERGGGFNGSLSFNCTAKQIQIANQELISITEPKFKRGQPKKKKGLQESPTAETNVEVDKKPYRSYGKSFFNNS